MVTYSTDLLIFVYVSSNLNSPSDDYFLFLQVPQ